MKIHLLLCLALLLSGCKGFQEGLQANTFPSPTTTPKQALRITNSSMRIESADMASVHGIVKNVGDANIKEPIMILVTIFDKNGTVLRTIRTSPDISPLVVGGDSTFDVMVTGVPGAKTFSISFADLDGHAIPNG